MTFQKEILNFIGQISEIYREVKQKRFYDIYI